ncbi:MAG TPA: FliM/FliN family flagellar motor switch protein [Phycisphaerae bacterium]|nr:FliM/FliN family flagellar motor switch protein [Phycisphaerae bacterium]
MSENQVEIDALLAEVNALAEEAVADIVGDQGADVETVVSAARPSGLTAQQSTGRTTPRSSGKQSGSGPAPGPGAVSRILRLEVPVIVELATRSMPLAEILNLSTGAIIEFDKPADSDLDLMINNKCIGRGQAVKAGENFGLRVSNIGSLRDLIQAMGHR